jgi:hypothetical protein
MPHVKSVVIFAAVLTLLLAGRVAMAARTPEPTFTVVQQLGSVELRRYAPVVRAVTVVQGMSWDAGLNEGFRRLAGYIFGGNRTRASIAMTSPVTAQPTSTKIAMTAPVTAAPAATGPGERGLRVTFTMPEGSTLETLPVPTNDRVTLEAMPERLVAVLPFSGFAGDEKFQRERARLLEAVRAAGLSPRGEPELARYDPPWTLPFLRRNEVSVVVVAE